MKIRVKHLWFTVTNECSFNGVKHYGVCELQPDGTNLLGWIPAWLIDERVES